MPFPVIVRTDLSLHALHAIHRSGGSVMKTPHVGNVYPCNLGVAQVGIPMVFYDRTFGNRDRNFHPHGVIRGGTFEKLSEEHLLTTHAKSKQSSSLAPEWFSAGTPMKDGHMRALRAAIPQMEGGVYTDILSSRSTDLLPILEIAFRAMPRLWDRYVHEDGVVREMSFRSWEQLMCSGILGITHANRGTLIPNTLNILLLTILEAKEKGVADAFHLSGPDMILYIKRLDQDLHHLYDSVRNALSEWKLPETLSFHIIPAVDMRFAVLHSRRAALDSLIDTYLTYTQNNRVYGERMRDASGADHERVKAEVVCLRREERERLIQAVHACPDVLYSIYDQNAPSQYDVLDAGGLYVHPWAIHAPMSELSAAMRQFERLAGVTLRKPA